MNDRKLLENKALKAVHAKDYYVLHDTMEQMTNAELEEIIKKPNTTIADRNLILLQNFILFATKSSNTPNDNNFRAPIGLTAENLYSMAQDYIEEEY